MTTHKPSASPDSDKEQQDMHSHGVRIFLIIVGWTCVILGLIGVVLPILPTTPFLLLAAACFSQSSKRFHGWLINNRIFGPIIKDWQEYRAMERKIKIRSLIYVALTFSVSIYLVPHDELRVMLLCFWAVCSFFIARIPLKEDSEKYKDSKGN